jgi:hypothetical protein
VSCSPGSPCCAGSGPAPRPPGPATW